MCVRVIFTSILYKMMINDVILRVRYCVHTYIQIYTIIIIIIFIFDYHIASCVYGGHSFLAWLLLPLWECMPIANILSWETMCIKRAQMCESVCVSQWVSVSARTMPTHTRTHKYIILLFSHIHIYLQMCI